MKRDLFLFCALFVLALTGCDESGVEKKASGDIGANITDYADFVDVSIGTSGNGHTFAAASLPFGFVQPGPDSGNSVWDYCSGYRFEDEVFTGFSQTHLSGAGVEELGDLLIMPFIGEAGDAANFYECPVRKETEKFAPGYYSVELDRFAVKVEITCSKHTSFYRFFYPNGRERKLMLDFQHGLRAGCLESVYFHRLYFPDDRTIVGATGKNGWVDRQYGFKVEFSEPVKQRSFLKKRIGENGSEEKAGRVVLTFEPRGEEPLMVKISLSTTDISGAVKNMRHEIPHWDFDRVRKEARDIWNEILGRVKLKKASRRGKRIFYTSLYHAFLAPSDIADCDGRYRGPDGKIAKSENGVYYSTFSTWDTFRALHPLLTILAPEIVPDMVRSMVKHYDKAGYLPIWTLWGKDSQCMIGTHSIPPIADAYFKGLVPEDLDIFTPIKETLTKKHESRRKEEWEYLEHPGYYPCDRVSESVSRTLECSYDDWCAYKLAEAFEKKGLASREDVELFGRRSENWKNVIDPKTGFARGRKLKGGWKENFDPAKVGGDFTEGNAWQYTWHVMHDPEGLIKMLGGREKALAKLESLFAQEKKGGRPRVVSGLIGEYAHGNEPSHHVAYLFPYLGRPEKTAELVGRICGELYDDTPEGLCGNEDCGQMSAWYVFSVMGFYPMNPCGGDYVIGAPQHPEFDVALPGGKSLKIVAKGLSRENKYVENVYFNGEKISSFILKHSELMKGGELTFIMQRQ